MSIREIAQNYIPGYDPWENTADCTFDEDAAQTAIDFFFEHLTFVEGKKAGQPFALELWQQAIIANTFGWFRPDGTRRYRQVFLFVPRKNGKTPLAAGIVLLVAVCDDEPGMQLYSVAAETAQAALVFRHAKQMVLNSPWLTSLFDMYARSLVLKDDQMSFYQYVSATSDSKHGKNAHLVVIDELHVCKRDLCEVFRTAQSGRDEPLEFNLTTADFQRESVCNERQAYAEKVRDGEIDDPSFLPVIYAAKMDDDWRDEKLWRLVNPNLGVSKNIEYMRERAREAEAIPATLMSFLRFDLNIKTSVESQLIPPEVWALNDGELDILEYEGRTCKAALDLAATNDLVSLCLAFRDGAGEVYDFFWWHWLPEVPAAKVQHLKGIPYSSWAHNGWLTLTPGNEVYYAQIRREINEVRERFQIEELAIDRYFQGAQMSQDLMGDGFNVVSFGQGYASMAAPTAELVNLIKQGNAHHGNNPCMRWQASNVMVEMDAAGNIKPDKSKSADKIDGFVTQVMAVGLWSTGKKPSKYETEELVTL